MYRNYQGVWELDPGETATVRIQSIWANRGDGGMVRCATMQEAESMLPAELKRVFLFEYAQESNGQA